MSPDLLQFIPLALLLVIALGFGLTGLIVPALIGKRRVVTPIKDSPYECGLPAASDKRLGFSVKFYMVAMLFITFDLEVVFIVSWATAFQDLVRPVGADGLGSVVLWAMVAFIFVLEVGHFYVWKQGALSWAPKSSDAVAQRAAHGIG